MLKAWAGLMIAAVSLSAHATLGENASTVSTDQAALHATLTTQVSANYTDYMLTLPDGIVVHEFVNSASKVFEITWSGKRHRPDMQQLLGQYFTRFTDTSHKTRPTTRQAHQVTTELVIHSSAIHGYFSGTAHVPALLPETMTGPVNPVSTSQDVAK
ncbi:hypothetical protein S2091_2636 [Solimicrobium silvestre]|uniref:DUF2844 domain-containing protein n=2 Tax=Solimicrobium silvestre TaxID=2099400 RepID=A0A2S9GXZ5_9BURK|nr:hypothetical protein S2091_2636 [Solimicrobium silvestre]